MNVGRLRDHRQALIIGGVLLVAASVVVAFTLQRPDPPTFQPSPAVPDSARGALVGPRVYTVDASDPDRWVFFSFEAGSVVERPGPTDWDLAFRRFQIIANGGQGFAGSGGIRDLGAVEFDSVLVAPADGYEPTRARTDSVNAAIQDWYEYSFFSHLLSPASRVYAVRTAAGHHAKLEILGYYCPGARPGCLTFRYVYQGDGSRRFGEGPDG
jgi:hypothetical protein